jgi:tetratricopeptide (TPR) repeat protein
MNMHGAGGTVVKHARRHGGRAAVVALALVAALILLGVAMLLFGVPMTTVLPAAPGGGTTVSAPVSAPMASATAEPASDVTSTAPADKVDQILNAVLPLRTQQEWGKAEAILNEAIRTYPGEQVFYVQLGELLALQRKSKEAHAMFARAIAIGPSDAGIELAAGTVASDAGLTERAMEHYSQAQTLDATNWQAPLFLAQVQARVGKTAEAKKNLMLASQLKPDLAVAWGSLAELLLRENSVGPALQMVAKARTIEPDNVVWRLIEARALKRDNKPEAALQLLIGMDDAAKLQPGVLPLMGECFGLMNRPMDAAKQFGQVSDRFADKAELAVEAARWYQRAGDAAQAKKYAQRAQYLGNEEGRKLAEALEGK